MLCSPLFPPRSKKTPLLRCSSNKILCSASLNALLPVHTRIALKQHSHRTQKQNAKENDEDESKNARTTEINHKTPTSLSPSSHRKSIASLEFFVEADSCARHACMRIIGGGAASEACCVQTAAARAEDAANEREFGYAGMLGNGFYWNSWELRWVGRGGTGDCGFANWG